MLLGIVLHAALSFAPIPWIVQDTRQSDFFYYLFSLIHGFRMPLFFLVSGFFTAMLWRKRGLGSLVQQRCMRILLPLLLAMATIIPVFWITIIFAGAAQNNQAWATEKTKDGEGIWEAAMAGDTATLEAEIAAGANLNAVQSGTGQTPLLAAVAGDQPETVALLLKHGADPNQRTADKSTALHWAAILGHAQCAAELIDADVDISARNNYHSTAADNLKLDWTRTAWVAGLMRAKVDQSQVDQGRKKIATMLGSEGKSEMASSSRNEAALTEAWKLFYGLFFEFSLFHHLWFLWFLCWLVAGFAIYATLLDRLNIKRIPQWFTASPWRYLWLIPLTVLPQSVMGLHAPSFGPDTSSGLLPVPQVLFYYAVFFGFGALYYDSHDDDGRLGKRWYLTLPFALLVLFPLGMLLLEGESELIQKIPEQYHRAMLVVVQVLFAWTVACACMGMMRRLLHKENKAMRYISDSSYWLYLAHMPLVIILQLVVRNWPLPAFVKFSLVCVVTTLSLLCSYQLCVRYTWLGELLNGRRTRPKGIIQAVLAEDSSPPSIQNQRQT